MGILIWLESPLEILSSIAHSFPTHILRNLSSSFPISMLIFTGRCYVMLSFLLVFSLTNLMILSSIILHKSLSVLFFLLLLFWVLQITSSNNSLLLVVIWKNFFPPSCGTFCMLWSCCYSFFSSSKLKICVIAQIIMQGIKKNFLFSFSIPLLPLPPQFLSLPVWFFFLFFAFGKPLHERDTFRTISERGCMEPVRDKFLAFRLIFSL